MRVAQANALAQRGALFPTVHGNLQSRPASRSPSGSADHQRRVRRRHLQPAHHAGDGDLRRRTSSAARAARSRSTDALAEAQAFQREAVYLTLTVQHRARRDPGGVAARPDRRHAPADRACRPSCSTSCAGRTTAVRSRYPDVVAQETAVAQARLLLPPLEKQLAQQRDLLAYLTGRFPSEDMAATFQLRLVPPAAAAAAQPARRSRAPAARRACRGGQPARRECADRRRDRQPAAADHAHRQCRVSAVRAVATVHARQRRSG